MTRISILFVMCIAWALNGYANEKYKVEGYPTIGEYQQNDPKFWALYVNALGEIDRIRMYFMQQGDSIIEGEKYARICVSFDDVDRLHDEVYPSWTNNVAPIFEICSHHRRNYVDTLYFRQEGDKVFCLSKETKNVLEKPVLDFGLQEGETYEYPTGDVYRVINVGYVENSFPYVNYWYVGQTPKMLRLRNEHTGEEDIWVEGIGSMKWGITPLEMLNGIKPLWKSESKAEFASLFYSYCSNCLATIPVDRKEYKIQPFQPDNYDGIDNPDDYKELGLKYAFVNDTLWVRGLMEMNCYTTNAVCRINGSNVDISIEQITPQDNLDCAHYALINAKIPGFAAGTYFVNGQTLVCVGATGIDLIQNTKHTEKIEHTEYIFDFSGRRTSNPQHGLYIKDGKKVIQ